MIGEQIKYKIDNFNGMFPITTFEEFSKKINTKEVGVYLLYSEDRDITYVGKSEGCIRARLNTHLFQDPGKNMNENLKRDLLSRRGEFKFFSFIKTPIEVVNLVEVFLIGKYSPIFNKQFNMKKK